VPTQTEPRLRDGVPSTPDAGPVSERMIARRHS
jgi:hypothetical protein